MLPAHLRTIIKHIDQAVDKAESRADDRSKRAEKAQNEVTITIQFLANEVKTYQAKQVEFERGKNRREKLTIASLIVTAAITLVLAIIAGLQWHTLEKQWETFEKTDHTLKDTLGASQVAQRAFVAIKEIAIAPVGRTAAANDIVYRIGAIWENSGTTQAKDLEIDFEIALMPQGDLPPWELDGTGTKFALLPKATLEAGDLSANGVKMNSVHAGKLFIFYQGLARYLDAFGGKHLTMACYRVLAGPVDYTKEGSKGVLGVQCEQYNCTDEDCRRYEAIPTVKEALKFLN